MASTMRSRVAECLLCDAVASEVVAALRTQGIDSVLLKGPATVHHLYPDDPWCRRYGDVDVLVAPDHYGAAGKVIAGLGFTDRHAGIRKSEADRMIEQVWDRGRGEMVELHRSFAGVGDADAFWASVNGARERLDVAGVDVAIPGPAGAALVYALHAAQHGNDRDNSMKPMADLRRAIARFPLNVWRTAAELAAACGAVPSFVTGLSLDPAGAELLGCLGIHAEVPRFVLVRATTKTLRGASRFGEMASAPSFRARARGVLDVVVPSPAMMRAALPAERRAQWRRRHIPFAYVERWISFTRHAPAAFADLMRARRCQPRANNAESSHA